MQHLLENGVLPFCTVAAFCEKYSLKKGNHFLTCSSPTTVAQSEKTMMMVKMRM